ncbi:male sterility protein-domain-containing protein [Zychaea mexicana]|uniref:male sterility protein-domain-containing protein n=1 Tax=Zychaea mexicana TaxID=64656 RepID=UPI0022FDEEB9|nr:male sterility protein-domain-containing protein [Zychaea mexicana]KAI9489880.1 male sterility protein-domain-containing protein [Zychaea mexicana]
MAEVPTISITNPELESQDLNMTSPVTPSPPGSPTVFDVVKNMEALDRDDMYENDPTAADFPETPTPTPNHDHTADKSDSQVAPVSQEQEQQHQSPHPPEESTPTTESTTPTVTESDPQDQPSLNVREFYQNKAILLTGATGFVGKALLWKLLSLDVRKIFILLRTGQRRPGSAFQRIKEDILTNKAFVALRRSMGPTLFDRMIRDKVCAMEGDLAMPGLGLSEEDRKTLVKDTNIVLHCAATVDGNERLDMAVKVNVLGTLNLIELANECMTLTAFIHLSPLQMAPGSSAFEDRLLPIPSQESPHVILSTILSSSFEDLPAIFDDYKRYYPDTYLFSKSLVEHLIISEVERKRSNGGYQYPVAIMRSSPIGPSANEPLVGWADGVNGANGTLLLTGRGVRVIQPGGGNANADIVPVDFVVRMILGCAVSITPPSSSAFDTPIPDVDAFNEQRSSTPTPSTVSSPTNSTAPAIRDSGSSAEEATSVSHMSMESRASSKTSVRPLSIEGPMGAVFPYMYHITTANMRCLPWRIAYEPIRQYWTKATKINLPPAQSYFTSSAGGLNRARTVMNSIRSYMGNNGNVPPTASTSSDRTRKRSSQQRLSRQIDKATKLSWTMKSFYKPSSNNAVDINAAGLRRHLQSTELDPYCLVPEDADHSFWVNYFLNASYGIHYFIHLEPDLRLPVPLSGWSCALQSYDYVQGNDSVRLIDRPAQSAVFTADQISRRIGRMVAQVKDALETNAVSRTPQDDERWLGDMDDSLDDWCQDGAVFNSDKEIRMVLGKWRKKVGSNDDRVKIVVLNDKRVNQAINQITVNAGVQKQTAVNEAMKILVRMSERTQLQFVWFASYFLKNLFDDMFDNVRIQEESIRRIRAATLGKRVVYVPVTKSILDPLLVWYIAIRYHLPVPAFACDEALAQLGPISDIYRLAGAYYIKRDRQKRSPLNTAVMAAYTQVLLREHGALSIYMEKARSRTGKYQEPYDDGLIEMVVESTLQSNQTRSPAVSRVASLESNSNSSPPASPDTPSSIGSPTMSIDSSTGGNGFTRKSAHKDVFIVPINITYENMPELPYLLDELLDQHQPASVKQSNAPAPPMQNVMRPSEAKDKRTNALNGPDVQRKFGRVLMGIGPLVSVQDAAEELQRSSSGSVVDPAEESMLVKKITEEIQTNQRKALIVSPVSLVASIILYGRATGGVCFGKMKDMAEWLRAEVIMRDFQIDWQEGEDVDAVVLYAFRLLDETKNIIVEGKEITDDTNIRVNDHADNVMTLSYYANQATDVFLLDAFFAVVYLSFTEDKVIEDEFMDRFRFLAQMLEREFVLTWDIDQQFNNVLSMYEARKVIRRSRTDETGTTSHLILAANMESNPVRYEQLIFLASLLYPTIDSYWITSCSLSALDAVPMLPRSIVPLLAQWIATHLITGRRTIYREVLSTESSRTAADMFMTLGFLTEIQAKEKLSPDAQILLHELGIPTTEMLIQLSGQNSDGGQTEVSPVDPEGMMKALMAQIQMNRANSNMADLCQQIDTYRLGAMTQRETFQNKQVFQKCLKQIKGILQANTASFAKKRQVDLPENEEKLVQLVYALRTSSAPSVDRSSSTAQARALRRVSEAYNLRHY